MVSALSRCLANEFEQDELNSLFLPVEDKKFPCALREFINSNADLPTIEELAKKSAKFAEAVRMHS